MEFDTKVKADLSHVGDCSDEHLTYPEGAKICQDEICFVCRHGVWEQSPD